MDEKSECVHQHGGRPPPTAQSSGGWGLTRRESVSAGLQHPLVPPDPDSLAEALLHHDDLKGWRDEQQSDLTIKYDFEIT